MTPRKGPRPFVDRKLPRILGLVLLLTAFSTTGYHVIEGWTWLESLWMVVITFTTIGYGEVRPLSDVGRLFSIGVIISGLSVVSYVVTQTTSYMMEGGLRRDWAQRRIARRMRTLKDHHIIVGYGRLGREVAAELLHHGVSVVIVDMDSDELPDQAETQGMVIIHGDATHDAVLREAGIDNARGLAATTGSNAINILVTISARQLHKKLQIMTRVEAQEDVPKAYRAGATSVIVPHGLAGVNMAHGLLRPEARNFLNLAMTRSHRDLAFEDVTISADSGVHGRLRDLNLRERFKVAVVAVRKPRPPTSSTTSSGLRSPGSVLRITAIKDAEAVSLQEADTLMEMTTLPGPDTTLEPGDTAVIVGRLDDIQRFCDQVNPRRPRRGR